METPIAGIFGGAFILVLVVFLIVLVILAILMPLFGFIRLKRTLFHG